MVRASEAVHAASGPALSIFLGWTGTDSYKQNHAVQFGLDKV